MKLQTIGAAIGSAKAQKGLVPLRFTNVGEEPATIAYKHEAYQPSALISPNFTIKKDGVSTVWDYSAVTLQPGEYLEITGENTTQISQLLYGPPVNCYLQIIGGSVIASGNIKSLLNPKKEIALPEHAFDGLFYGCTGLTAAPELPATTLAAYCYNNMFNGCTGLTAAPELPATTLAAYCYNYMFNGCTGLTAAPELPATTLAESCYINMFGGCTGLTAAPELPATTLAESCYNNMFGGCTGLTAAPELPATTLAESCYSGMFNGCTGLTAAPELPATTLAESCYRGMFSGCTSLTAAPELPATTLAAYCYNNMFGGCTGLTAAPELPATTLAESCYIDMFNSCAGLEELSVAFANWDDENNATSGWLENVAATGTFTCPADLDTTTRDGSHVPENWTVQTAA